MNRAVIKTDTQALGYKPPSRHSRQSSRASSSPSSSLGSSGSRINNDMLLAPTICNQRKGREENVQKFLNRLTHLNLHGKGLKEIEGLEDCRRLQVLYLYENHIEHIENLDATANTLTHLYLQRNKIKKIENLKFPKLSKLFLCGNLLTEISGLEYVPYLQELHCSNQKLRLDTPLSFSKGTLEHLANTLLVLNCAGNNFEDIHCFRVLKKLEKLNLSKNRIENPNEVQSLLKDLVSLQDLDLRGNPLCQAMKYREHVILASSKYLEMLDGREIKPELRETLKRFQEHKKRIAHRRSAYFEDPSHEVMSRRSLLNKTLSNEDIDKFLSVELSDMHFHD